jgi:hypothetical protein
VLHINGEGKKKRKKRGGEGSWLNESIQWTKICMCIMQEQEKRRGKGKGALWNGGWAHYKAPHESHAHIAEKTIQKYEETKIGGGGENMRK